MSMACPCCGRIKSRIFAKKSNFSYFQCQNCLCIFLDPDVLVAIDNGESIVKYKSDYWKFEVLAARERAFGCNLARLAEVVHYAVRPIEVFLDIGTGPGFILDAVEYYLPDNKHIFHGVEKYPPPRECCTKSMNYHIGEIDSFMLRVDAGMCIEVLEHLTPKMFREILEKIGKISNPGATYIFNTGLADYVINEDIEYLDPTIRGHIMSYSVSAIKNLAQDLHFTTYPIQGKSWAVILEYQSPRKEVENIVDRIWHILPENKRILCDSRGGEVLRLLGLESARAYL